LLVGSAEAASGILPGLYKRPDTGESSGPSLSISYDIITRRLGGTVTLDSRVGEFTPF
jgi:signal transduction histidine kinase